MIVSKLLEKLNTIAPFDTALEWDNVGLLVGSKGVNVERVLVTLDVTTQAIRSATTNKCDLILSHHPLILSGIKSVTTDQHPGSAVCQMVASGINHIAMHTNFDVCQMGSLVAKKLGVEDVDVLDITDINHGKVRGIGICYNLKSQMTVAEYAKIVKEKFALSNVICYGDTKREVSRIAIVPGSGKSEIENAKAQGAQLLITGDITHHVGLDAFEEGLTVMDAGHYEIEKVFVNYMKEYLESETDLKVYAQDALCPRSFV